MRQFLARRFQSESTDFDALGLRLSERLTQPRPQVRVRGVRRLSETPLIHPGLSPSIGDNICGPSLVSVPPWAPNRLGAYYLYFAHHHGHHIRMAYADRIEGPWTVHEPGVLHLEDAPGFEGHIASPDVHVLPDVHAFIMYFHGPSRAEGVQLTACAHSEDGVRFRARSERLGKFYFRVWAYEGRFYALAKNFNTGWTEIYESDSQHGSFVLRGNILKRARHTAVSVEGDTLLVFYSRVGDRPERILLSTIDMSQPFAHWRPSAPIQVLCPQTAQEGRDLPNRKSRFGAAAEVRQLRDPCVFRDGDRYVLLYAVRGESGIAAAELDIEFE